MIIDPFNEGMQIGKQIIYISTIKIVRGPSAGRTRTGASLRAEAAPSLKLWSVSNKALAVLRRSASKV